MSGPEAPAYIYNYSALVASKSLMSLTNPSQATSVPGQALTHLSTLRLVGKEDSITYSLLLNMNKQISLWRGWTSFTNFLQAISVPVHVLARFRSLVPWKSKTFIAYGLAFWQLESESHPHT